MARRALIAVVIAAALAAAAGCGRHYWGKPGATLDEFNRDSAACARLASPAYGIVIEDNYRQCLRDRGWQREQKLDPAPPGWYRGIE